MATTGKTWTKVQPSGYRYRDTEYTVHGGDGYPWAVFKNGEDTGHREPTREFAREAIEQDFIKKEESA